MNIEEKIRSISKSYDSKNIDGGEDDTITRRWWDVQIGKAEPRCEAKGRAEGIAEGRAKSNAKCKMLEKQVKVLEEELKKARIAML